MDSQLTQVLILDSSRNDDVYICGMCKSAFYSLEIFIAHKTNCAEKECQDQASLPCDFSNSICDTNLPDESFELQTVGIPNLQCGNDGHISKGNQEELVDFPNLPILDDDCIQENEHTLLFPDARDCGNLLEDGTMNFPDTIVTPTVPIEAGYSDELIIIPRKDIDLPDSISVLESVSSSNTSQCIVTDTGSISYDHNNLNIIGVNSIGEDYTGMWQSANVDTNLMVTDQAVDMTFTPKSANYLEGAEVANPKPNFSNGKQIALLNIIVPIPNPIPRDDTQSEANKEIPAKDPNCNGIFCPVCKKTFKTLKCLYSHLKLHESPSQCIICGRLFESNSHLNRHIETHRIWPNGLTEIMPKRFDVALQSYSCPYCDYVLSSYSSYRLHLNTHLDLKPYKCIQSNCDGFFKTMNNLLEHIAANHPEPRYTCHLCKKVFVTLAQIATHHRYIHEANGDTAVLKPRFKCDLCDSTFTKQEILALHILTEKHNQSCIHCRKTFVSSKRLRTHLQIHRTRKEWRCNECNSYYMSLTSLTKHKRTHGARKYKCKICKESFKRQDILFRHKKLHSKTKRELFKCTFKDIDDCGRTFSRKDKLDDHVRVHEKRVKRAAKQDAEYEAKLRKYIEIYGEI